MEMCILLEGHTFHCYNSNSSQIALEKSTCNLGDLLCQHSQSTHWWCSNTWLSLLTSYLMGAWSMRLAFGFLQHSLESTQQSLIWSCHCPLSTSIPSLLLNSQQQYHHCTNGSPISLVCSHLVEVLPCHSQQASTKICSISLCSSSWLLKVQSHWSHLAYVISHQGICQTTASLLESCSQLCYGHCSVWSSGACLL